VAAEHTPFLAHLRKFGNFEDALSDRDAVQSLLDSQGWALLMQLIDSVHEEAVMRALFAHAGSEGRVLEQAEYARLLGFLAGLRQVRWAAEAYVLRAERAQAQEE
jgi:GTP1/Obg family GTP-binding protein